MRREDLPVLHPPATRLSAMFDLRPHHSSRKELARHSYHVADHWLFEPNVSPAKALSIIVMINNCEKTNVFLCTAWPWCSRHRGNGSLMDFCIWAFSFWGSGIQKEQDRFLVSAEERSPCTARCPITWRTAGAMDARALKKHRQQLAPVFFFLFAYFWGFFMFFSSILFAF